MINDWPTIHWIQLVNYNLIKYIELCIVQITNKLFQERTSEYKKKHTKHDEHKTEGMYPWISTIFNVKPMKTNNWPSEL